VKDEGFRILVLNPGQRVKVWTGRDADFTDRFTRIASDRGLVAEEGVRSSKLSLRG
jgi:hypothetical protein